MPVAFPAVVPDEREFQLGTFPQTRMPTESGRIYRKPLASRDGGHTLQLGYKNKSDSVAETFRRAHRDASSGYEALTLPPEVWAGDTELATFIAELSAPNAPLVWSFAQEPQIVWKKRGVVDIQIVLKGVIRTQLTRPAPPLTGGGDDEGLTTCLSLSQVINGQLRATSTGVKIRLNNGNYAIVSENQVDSNLANVFYYVQLRSPDNEYIWGRRLTGPGPNFWDVSRQPTICEGPDNSLFVAFRRTLTQNQTPSVIHLLQFSESGTLLDSTSYGYSEETTPGGGMGINVTDTGCISFSAANNAVYGIGSGNRIFRWDASSLAMTRAYRYPVGAGSGNVVGIYTSATQITLFTNLFTQLYGFGVIDTNPDFTQINQQYRFELPSTSEQVIAYTRDTFGVYYVASRLGRRIKLYRLAGASGGFIPIWGRSFQITELNFDPRSAQMQVIAGNLIVLTCLWSNGAVSIITLSLEANDEVYCNAYSILTAPTETPKIRANVQAPYYDPVRDVVLFEDNAPLNIGLVPRLLPDFNITLGIVGSRTLTGRGYYTRFLLDNEITLPNRTVYNTAPTAVASPNSVGSAAWNLVDLVTELTYSRVATCFTRSTTASFLVSEALGSPTAALNAAGDGFMYSKAIVTPSNRVYWTGRATLDSNQRYFLNLYDTFGNRLWGRWLDGPYSQSTFSEPCLCPGLADGVFLATKGLDGGNSPSPFLGASIRLHAFNGNGALTQSRAWQFANNGSGRAVYEDTPVALHYQSDQDRLYVAGRNGTLTVFRASQLDQAYGLLRSPNNNAASMTQRWFWDPSNQRIGIVGMQPTGEQGGDGFFLRTFSPNLQTQHEAYTYAVSGTNPQGFGIGPDGTVYILRSENFGWVLRITALSPAAGYTPLWTRQFNLTMPPGAVGNADSMRGASLDFTAQGAPVISIHVFSNTTLNGTWLQMYTLNNTFTNVVSITSLRLGQSQRLNNYLQGSRLSRDQRIVAFPTGQFTLGIADTRLPALPNTLEVITSTTNGLNPSIITGQTAYVTTTLSNTTSPTRTAWTSAMTTLNTMVEWTEPAWTASDLTETVTADFRSTPGLQTFELS
jgi:hypothetical protein